MNDNETLLKEVFGESSDSDSESCELVQHHHHHSQDTECEETSRSNRSQNLSWERIDGIKGLCLCRNFLSPQEQSSLLRSIEDEGWFTDASHNQAMRFGDLPTWASELSYAIHDAVFQSDNEFAINDVDEKACILPSDILWREPLFDQLIVNAYQPGEGICAHVDLMRFEDGIAIVSLESSCVMHFTQVEEARSNGQPAAKIPVYLTPGSLVVMSGEARYLWKHEINRKPGFQIWEGKELIQRRRISITLRKLCHSE